MQPKLDEGDQRFDVAGRHQHYVGIAAHGRNRQEQATVTCSTSPVATGSATRIANSPDVSSMAAVTHRTVPPAAKHARRQRRDQLQRMHLAGLESTRPLTHDRHRLHHSVDRILACRSCSPDPRSARRGNSTEWKRTASAIQPSSVVIHDRRGRYGQPARGPHIRQRRHSHLCNTEGIDFRRPVCILRSISCCPARLAECDRWMNGVGDRSGCNPNTSPNKEEPRHGSPVSGSAGRNPGAPPAPAYFPTDRAAARWPPASSEPRCFPPIRPG